VPALTALAGQRAWWPGRAAGSPRALMPLDAEPDERVLEAA
jgi:hypothetical protein